jgi:hypothetical protein
LLEGAFAVVLALLVIVFVLAELLNPPLEGLVAVLLDDT